ncbi:hypothetical protein NDU88_005887 [Pleurodeles waltl]|uniref:Uncharacterized protein n=1 Tax=Pleurodeles waltl TaxID=8319 RepID=A0AAV7NNM0_PLEWA|nr:hypothetical protein NDU88_005887 [Pleurodeles waltl]
MGAARDVTRLAKTTVLDDLVAEVLGWDLDILVLGEGQGGGIGKKSMLARKSFLDTLGREDGGGLGVEEELVVVGGVRLLNLGEGAWAGGFCEEDGPDAGLVAAVEPVDSEEEEAEEEDIDNRNTIIMQYLQ